MLRKKLPPFINGFMIIEDLGILNKRRSIIAKCKKCLRLFKTTKDHVIRNKIGCTRKCASNKGGTKRLCKIRESMIARCNNKQHVSFLNYSSNNIKVCDEWLTNSSSFYTWALSNGYRDDLTLDRIDNSKGYFPENCRWSDKKIQSQNSSQAKLTIEKVKEILILCKTMQQKEVAKIFNVCPATINGIVKNLRWKNVDRNL